MQLRRMSDLVVVLYEPQDDINIGSVVRATQNFGLSDLRLVRPRVADRERIRISAPNAEEAVDRLQIFDDLDTALADTVRVFGATARGRSAAQVVGNPMQAAREAAAISGRVALLFGREDHGLPNEALDRCDLQITIPTSPGYRSMNLAQAVLLMVWEMYRHFELTDADREGDPSIESEFDAAPREQVERMFAEAQASLEAVEFFKYGDGEHVMRSVRNVFLRAGLDRRELAIWFGIFKEIRAFIDRKGER